MLPSKSPRPELKEERKEDVKKVQKEPGVFHNKLAQRPLRINLSDSSEAPDHIKEAAAPSIPAPAHGHDLNEGVDPTCRPPRIWSWRWGWSRITMPMCPSPTGKQKGQEGKRQIVVVSSCLRFVNCTCLCWAVHEQYALQRSCASPVADKEKDKLSCCLPFCTLSIAHVNCARHAKNGYESYESEEREAAIPSPKAWQTACTKAKSASAAPYVRHGVKTTKTRHRQAR